MSTKPTVATSAPAPSVDSQTAPEKPGEERKDVLAQILEWSQGRPAWQRDGLRRLLTTGNLSPKDFDELTAIAKSAHGLARKKADPLTSEHVAIRGRKSVPVSILSVTHLQGVNALAPNQTVAFGPSLTVVFGQNAAGKSGYTRILKRACRSRGTENILGNVLSGQTPVRPEATIRYREGTTELPLDWKPDTAPSEALASVSVFDSHSASVYVRDKTDVAFRPFGLDIFDRLSVACAEIRTRLEAEIQKLNRAAVALPIVPDGTRVKAMIEALSGLTKIEDVHSLAAVTEQDEERVKELRGHKKDVESSDPRQRARELKLRAERFNLLARHLDTIADALGDPRIAELQAADHRLLVAKEALESVRKSAISPSHLSGTGEEAWRTMWDAAKVFSNHASPQQKFPLVENSLCPFCQQIIGKEAASRLAHFAEYVSSDAQTEVQHAEKAFAKLLSTASDIEVQRNDIALALSEVAADDGQLSRATHDSLNVPLLFKPLSRTRVHYRGFHCRNWDSLHLARCVRQ
ncbi:MAG: hypothetical protein JWO13_3518 [Acidobacteriales bacterium]|nr:hypothetical protein [Terriglobales bacterium]